LSPALRRAIADSLDAQVEALRRDQVSVRCEPKSIHYDAARDRVLISGKQISTGPAAAPVTRQGSTRCGSPSATTVQPITHLDAYQTLRERTAETSEGAVWEEGAADHTDWVPDSTLSAASTSSTAPETH